MLVMLDGINGVGKSTVAKLITERTGLKSVRPFRDSPDVHWRSFNDGDAAGESEVEEHLRAARVPFNTFVDNLYLADIVSKLGADTIMDRTMHSSVAYGLVKGEELYRDARLANWMVGYWESLIQRCRYPRVFALLTCDYEVSAARCEREGRWHPPHHIHRQLAGSFFDLHRESRLNPIIIDTTEMDANTVATRVLDHLRRIETP